MATRKAATPEPAAEKERRGPGGRPTKLTPEIIRQAAMLSERGLTDQEMADLWDVTVRTLYRWRHDSQEFCHALKAGKAHADDRVERSLYALATGYEHDEVDIKVIDRKIVQTTIRKHYPPHAVAGIFWLKNRRPDRWRSVPVDGEDDPAPTKVVLEVVDARKSAEAEPAAG